MKRHAIVLLASLVLVPALAAARHRPAGPTRKSGSPSSTARASTAGCPKITGYDAGVNFGNTFRVENGVLKVAYDQYDTFGNRFGHLFYKTPFSHYVLAVEYRFVGEQAKDGPDWAFRNSGAMIHGQPVETMQKDQDFPISHRGAAPRRPRATGSPARPRTCARRGRTW